MATIGPRRLALLLGVSWIVLIIVIAVLAASEPLFRTLRLTHQIPRLYELKDRESILRFELTPDEYANQIDFSYALQQDRVVGFIGVAVGLAAVLAAALNKLAEPTSPGQTRLLLALIIGFGLTVRLFLALINLGNLDMDAYYVVADIVGRGGNVYAETIRYNYSPVWSWVIGGLHALGDLHLPLLRLYSLVRIVLSLADVLTLAVLAQIARLRGLPLIKTSILFFLNPLSMLISGYHGQFENLSVLFLLIGLLAYLRSSGAGWGGKIGLWIGATAGLILKHNTFTLTLAAYRGADRRWLAVLAAFGLSAAAFALTFLPYLPEGQAGIVQNVFGYGSIPGRYGITTLVTGDFFKYAFLAGMVVYPLLIRSEDVIERCLMSAVFFVTFITGLGVQYFIIPVALGTLKPSKGFLAYSVLGSLALAGAPENVYIPLFAFLTVNAVWPGALFWFISNHFNINLEARKAVMSDE